MRLAVILMLLGSTGCINPTLLKPLFSAKPPELFESFKEGPSLPKQASPEVIEFLFPSDSPLRLIVRAPTGGWKQEPVLRQISDGISTYTQRYIHTKTNSTISLVASTWGGDDAFSTADTISGILIAMGIPVIEPSRTSYQSVNGWEIHRADYSCITPPHGSSAVIDWLKIIGCAEMTTSMRKKTVLVSFHDPRLTQATASMKIMLAAEWPKDGTKAVNRALYELSAFARVKSGL